jgi:hypothetical protein
MEWYVLLDAAAGARTWPGTAASAVEGSDNAGNYALLIRCLSMSAAEGFTCARYGGCLLVASMQCCLCNARAQKMQYHRQTQL